jgi:purine nucleosidase
MNRLFPLCLLLFQFLHFSPLQAQAPIPVILDTDMDSDVDDVGALAMLHAYAKQGKVKIVGIIVTSDDAHSAPCTDVINRYFGAADIPIGVSQRDSLKSFSKYTAAIAKEFPVRFPTNAGYEDGTTVYRRLLAGQKDGSVVIITIGHLTSLSRLLASGPDRLSTLGGAALIQKKVKKWSCMGGQFPSGKEANFYRPDPGSTVQVLAQWKLPAVFAGWEIGNLVVTGGARFKAACKPRSPVYRAYELYNDFAGRASWDQLSVLEAVEGIKPFFSLVQGGSVRVAADGSNVWDETPNPLQGYLKLALPAEEVSEKIEQLMLVK